MLTFLAVRRHSSNFVNREWQIFGANEVRHSGDARMAQQNMEVTLSNSLNKITVDARKGVRADIVNATPVGNGVAKGHKFQPRSGYFVVLYFCWRVQH